MSKVSPLFLLPLLLLLLIFVQSVPNPRYPNSGQVLGAPFQTTTPTGTVAPITVVTSIPTASATPTVGSLPTVTPTATVTPEIRRIRITATPRPTFTTEATNTPRPTFTAVSTLPPTFTPAPEPTPANAIPGLTVRIPILMYHFLSVPSADADIFRKDLSVSPENFEAQLTYLREQNYTTISLVELTNYLTDNGNLPEKPIILTFDDGYADNYTNAFPLLQEYGFKATFSLVTQPIDFGDPNYLSWDNVIEMHASGMEFGAHTYRHSDLRNRDVDFLIYEIVGSKEAIEARINEPVRFFVYPSGQYDQLTLDVVESANFWGALTIEFGLEHRYAERFEMPRIRIRGADTLEQFINKVEFEE